MTSRLTKGLPNLLTLLGHALTLAWLAGAPWPFALIGLFFDDLDGFAARRLDAASEFGSLYDWTVDVTSAAVVAVRLHLLPLLVVLVPAQVLARRAGRHVSGRALLVMVALAHDLLPGALAHGAGR
jgi:phosphatidylglycerophosphate synthase